MSIHEIEGGITAVDGITASGITAGIKKNNRSDLALIVARHPCAAAGVFTKNRCPASSILFDKFLLRSRQGQAIIANSGNANAATGLQGMNNTKTMARATAESLGLPVSLVYVASTGVIGEFLPIKRIENAIPDLVNSLSKSNHRLAAEAIMTTDRFAKEIALSGPVGGSQVRVGGMAKGSGMIHPNMATMLSFLTTDVSIDPDLLQESLHEAVDRTFHCITVDGETSTNDMALLFATGQMKNPIRKKGKAYQQFVALLEAACKKLAQDIVKDGEGATKFIEIQVIGAFSDRAARQIAASIARSSLVKTAFFGEDANWGRIIAAIGNAGVKIKMEKLDLMFGKTPLLIGGVYQGKKAEASASKTLQKKEIALCIDLHQGVGSATVWTSDLTIDYIKINASYRS